MIQIRQGNLLESDCEMLVNAVNCVGVMGKGIALAFRRRFPVMYQDYALACSNRQIRPGVLHLYRDASGKAILSFPTKVHWRDPSVLEYIRKGLAAFRANYWRMHISSVAFPALGCGNGGLAWEVVGPLMVQMLEDLPIKIEIYAPLEVSPEQGTIEFLRKNNKCLQAKIENDILKEG